MKLHFFSDYSIIIRSMKKVKHILSIFFQSFIPHDGYYPKLLHIRFQFSLKYYFFCIVFLSYMLAGVVVYQYSPKKIVGYKDALINTLSTFPEDVKITITNGVLELNQNRPFFLWVYENKQPLFVVMAHARDKIDNTRIPLPLIFLGSDYTQVVYKNYMKTFPYNPMRNFTFTKDTAQGLIAQINALFPSFLIGFYLILLTVLPILFITTSTVLILISSLITFILLRSFIPHIHLKKSIQAGMHGTHIPLLITILFYTLLPSCRSIFIVSSALIFVFTLVATFEMYSKEV